MPPSATHDTGLVRPRYQWTTSTMCTNSPPVWPPVENSDRKSTRLNSSHLGISYAVFCLKKKKAPPIRPLVACLGPHILSLIRSPARFRRDAPPRSFFLKEARPPGLSTLSLQAALRI